MNEYARQIWMQLVADRKKFGLICGLLALGLLLWGRLLLKEVPKTATATPAKASLHIDSDLLATSDTSRTGRSAPPLVVLKTHASPQRDAFLLEPSYYKQTSDAEKLPTQPKLPKLTPDTHQRMIRISEAGEQLELQSVLGGDEPRVMINHRLLKPGQTIEGFTVVRVEDRSVVLEYEGVMVRLGM